jgi:predicted nucleic acid-binding Zn ribbon protein
MPRRKSDVPSGPPEHVGAIVAGFLRSSGLDKRVAQAGIIPEWPRLVGPQVAAVTEPLRIAANGTLFVAVATNPWMNELSLLEPQLLAAINVVPGREPVRRIRWQVKR